MNKNNSLDSKVFNVVIQFLQIVLLTVSVIVSIKLGMERMQIKAIINVSFDWMALLVLIVLFRNICNGTVQNNTREIKGLIVSQYLCIFFEIGAWLFDAVASYRFLNYLSNMGCNCMLLAGAYIYSRFVLKSGNMNASKYLRLEKLLRVTMVIGIIAEILNYFGGYFYVIGEDGVYSRSSYGSFLGYIPFLIIILGSMILIMRQRIRWQLKVAYMSYSILPLLCSVWYTVTGFPPTFFVATAISILMIHGDIYVVQSKEVAISKLEKEKTEAEYALSQNLLMLSQIKPHFIYNSLGNIEVLCKLDPDKAGRAVHHFTQYLRSNMDIVSSADTIPFSQELEHIRNYVWLERMRFEDELEYREEIETTDFRIPQLSIQPLVENAIKHGMVGTKLGVLHLLLKTQETAQEYVITVSDDGCGFDPEHIQEEGRTHLGILSAQHSLKFRVDGTLHINSRIGSGTKVIIRIPKEMTYNHLKEEERP